VRRDLLGLIEAIRDEQGDGGGADCADRDQSESSARDGFSSSS